MEFVSPRGAAERLGLSLSTVRGLLRSGRLPARRVGRSWLIPAEELEEFAGRERAGGRPLSARSCWALLAVAGGWQPPAMSRTERQRARARADRIADLPAGALDARASPLSFFAHPSLLDAIADDRRLCLGGVSAASRHGAGVIAPERLEAYVRAADLPALADRHALLAGPGNVLLRVPAIEWPLPEGRIAPAAVVAWDLIDAGDQRSVRAGRALLSQAHGHRR